MSGVLWIAGGLTLWLYEIARFCVVTSRRSEGRPNETP